jgi:hypothetical protein
MEEEIYDHLYIQSLTTEALKLADISFQRAFALDETNIADQVPDYGFSNLAERFYDKVYSDETLK